MIIIRQTLSQSLKNYRHNKMMKKLQTTDKNIVGLFICMEIKIIIFRSAIRLNRYCKEIVKYYKWITMKAIFDKE